MSSSPGIFYNSKFVVGGNKGALEYADDKEKLPDNIRSSLFLNYMDNPKKASGLINMEGNYVTKEERKAISDKFDQAEEAGSLLWQDLFSFDHDWLAKHGMYDERTQTFDLVRISKAIIATEKYIFEKEAYQQPIGCFAFHVNTDNLHAHFSMMELAPSREKKLFRVVDTKTGEIKQEMQPVGARDKSVIKGAKRIFANRLLQYDQELTQITEMIRKTIVSTMPEKEVFLHPAFENAFVELYQKLPMQRNRWQYGYAKGQHFQQEIDHLIQLHLDTFYEKDYQELVQKITEIDVAYQEAYKGIADKSPVGVLQEDGSMIGEQTIPELDGNFKQTKLQELYSKMGNSLLREIKEMDKEMRKEGINPKQYFCKKNLSKTVEEGLQNLPAPLIEEKEISNEPVNDWSSVVYRPPKPITKEVHFNDVLLESSGVSKAILQRPTSYYSFQEVQERAKQQYLKERQTYKQELQKPVKQKYRSSEEFQRAVEMEKVMRRMQKAFYKDFKTWKLEQAFEELQREIQFHHYS
ncbi:MobP2 family relaxase [Listeria seeligeri]|uniref:MobP2 family relaxase n=1 Tax=Listeria seeligeri TaxID=1640 RepID=UPI001626D7D1|nr:MobP2 family relaxase [Listeria seeligeri]MBC1746906.1 hypothetical protein [Listeria seeligeri]MBC2233045.1 hypothetical protein [Listeria seeligeri]MBF2626125.1 hypothetical protein [Listeria seeligeri]MBF2673481.1 hypothetical protein [Listeria seeligeri]